MLQKLVGRLWVIGSCSIPKRTSWRTMGLSAVCGNSPSTWPLARVLINDALRGKSLQHLVKAWTQRQDRVWEVPEN